MPKCLGIYIEDDVIKYSKVCKEKDNLKIDSYNTVFLEGEKIEDVLEKIVNETFSTRDMVSVNISGEVYNYFEVFSALKPADQRKSINLDFELLCEEKGYKKDTLEARYIVQGNKENNDKLRVLHISTNKENLNKRVQNFDGIKVNSATSISTSISNLLDLSGKESNVIIVNLEKDTKITTILNNEVYNINIIPDGMEEILDKINKIENSMKKSYECLRNTTIYTQDSQELQSIDDNEHIEDVMPTLYNIVSEVKKIVDSTSVQISKVYITGCGTAINNIDLYFQEYLQNVKCELLKPFFMENSSIKIPIKEYIEVNSATALALEGLGYGIKGLNFRTNDSGSKSVSLNGLLDWQRPLTALDTTLLRLFACVCVGIVGYACISNYIIDKIEEKTDEANSSYETASEQVSLIEEDITQVKAGTAQYTQLISALSGNSDEEDDEITSDVDTDITETVITKDSIPNLLNRIVYIIPDQVKITSIQNTTGIHIVIKAEASKYEQLGYFKAALTNDGILNNVKSTSGSKSGETVTITIEGDLP